MSDENEIIFEELEMEEAVKQFLVEHPDVDQSLQGVSDALLRVVSSAIKDTIIGILSSVLAVLSLVSEPIGYILGTLEAQKNIGQRKAFSELRPSLLPDDVALTAYIRGLIDENALKEELSQRGYSDEKIDIFVRLSKRWLDVSEIVSAYKRDILTRDEAIDRLERLGYSYDDAEIILRTSHEKIAPDMLVSLWMREAISDDELYFRLRELGYTDIEISDIIRLSEIIPSPNDLIRFAVREVFSPAIADKFGLFEDFPEEFAKYGKMVGLNEFWAKAYWAAHWELPSPQMGFMMLHRGIITKEELEMLLRALDVMPFWREKLIQLSYDVYTRVDVRRMYKLGILDREQVKKAYMEMGYDEEKAENLTKFTELDVLDEERTLSKSEILSAYESGIITKDDAIDMLRDLKYTDNDIFIYIALIEYRKTKKIRDARISAIHSQYIHRKIDRSEAIRKLTALALSADEIDTYIEKWDADLEAKAERLSKQELNKALQYAFISEDEYRKRLREMGYPEDDINILVKLARKGV